MAVFYHGNARVWVTDLLLRCLLGQSSRLLLRWCLLVISLPQSDCLRQYSAHDGGRANNRVVVENVLFSEIAAVSIIRLVVAHWCGKLLGSL